MLSVFNYETLTLEDFLFEVFLIDGFSLSCFSVGDIIRGLIGCALLYIFVRVASLITALLSILVKNFSWEGERDIFGDRDLPS